MMNLNLTFLGQMLTFIVFVWFTMKYVWPPIMQAIDDRQQKIADGLSAAEQGKRELEISARKAQEAVRDAKIQAAQLIENANKRAALIIDDAKEKARAEGEQLINLSKAEIDKEVQKAKQELRQSIASIAMLGAEKILNHHLDEAANTALIEKMITEI